MASVVRYGTLEDERVSSDVMDEKRHENTAYEYLCHLEETRIWIQACINEQLPPATELEEDLRNGVYLAKLAHFVAPALVLVNKIYDFDQSIYKSRGLQFRHTENINHWFSAMKAVGMSSSCHPETFDIYDKRNMPKAIYCLHTFSIYLFKKGLAPKIEDLFGKLTFTAEEIEAMQKELDKYAVQMPSFSKIGGALASELPLDVAALHASIIAINKTLDRKNSKFLESLQNPHTHLNSVVAEYAERYKQGMSYSKKVKIQNCRRAEKPNYVSDIYDELLTQEEIQQCIHEVNEIEALDTLDIALTKIDAQTVMKLLRSPHLKLVDVEPANKMTYLKLLLEEREATIENNNPVFLSRAEVQRIILQGNHIAKDELKTKEVIIMLNKVIREADIDKTIKCLKDKQAKLPPIIEEAQELYQKELCVIQQAKQNDLTYEDVYEGVKILTAIAAINMQVQKGDSCNTLNALQSSDVHLAAVNNYCREKYFNTLRDAWEHKNVDRGIKFLTHNEIQKCISVSNKSWEEERVRELARFAIDSAVSSGNAEKVLISLMNPAASILCIDASHAVLYLEVLQDAQHHHSKLSLETVQKEINAANKLAREASKTAMAVIAINMAIKDDNPNMLLEVLEKEDAYIGPINPEYIDDYFSKLSALLAEKDMAKYEQNCDNWLHLSFGMHNYYFNCHTFEYSWGVPDSEANFGSFLQHEEIQAAVLRINFAHKRKKIHSKIEPAIVKFQAHVKSFLRRKEKVQRLMHFLQHEKEVILLQRWWRNCIGTRRQFELEGAAARKIQSCVRKWLSVKKSCSRMDIFKAKEENVGNFQRYWRTKRHLKNLRMANPNLADVWEHIPILISSTKDNVEEIEFHKVRADVVQRIRKNKDLEKKVNDMDVKIGLIVRNRITSDEFAREGRKGSLNKKDSVDQYDTRTGTMRQGLRALNKESRRLLESYQHLFYALQTDPHYLARLIFAMSPGHSFKFESVIYTLFNYGATPREEYLLFLLFRYALEEEFRCKIDKVSDISCGNTLLFKMVINYNRSGCGQSHLRQLLEGPVSYIIQKEDLYLGVDPVEIYQRWINKQETETGVMSKLPCDVPPEEALKYTQVVEEIGNNLNRLKLEALIFVDAICNSVEMIPYGIRYICKLLCKNLKSKFPGISEDETLKTVGNLLYYRYINPAIAAPDVYEIVILQPGETISAEQRKNLGSVAKVLHMAAAFKVFENGDRLAEINYFILECHKKFRKLFVQVCNVEEPQVHFNISIYTEDTLMTPPTVCLSLQEIVNTHELLCVHEECVAPDPSDKLHGLLKDVGNPRTLLKLIGQEGDDAANYSKSEVCLSLTNKFSVESGSSTNDSLFVETKRMVVHLLQCQPPRVTFSKYGLPIASLLDTIKSSPGEEENKAYTEFHGCSTFFQKDIIFPILKKNKTLADFKECLVGNLHCLEAAKYISTENSYQEMVDKLHENLSHHTEYRNKRREDIRNMKEALAQLVKKTEFYQSKLEYYENYMKNCLGLMNPNKKSGRRLTLGSSQELNPVRTKRYTAHKLIEKGILQEINMNTVETRAATFEISPAGEAGVFNVVVKMGTVEIYNIDISIQDLLQKQYEGEIIVEMFETVKININLLLHLLNTKFF